MNGSIELVKLSKIYDEQIAVADIDLRIPSGSYCCLLGPSGCGKSTTLRMIAGHEEVSDGDILLNNTNVTDLPPRQRGTAMMFQNYALFPHMTNLDNVAYSLKIAGQSKEQRQKAAQAMLALVNMADYAEKYPGQLSGGQQQRIALARALVCKPDVVLLDEPLSALDPFLRIQMRKELKQLQKNLGITFVHVTHSQEEAFALADIAVVMNNGAIVQVGEPKAIFERPNSSFVADFIGGHNVLTPSAVADDRIDKPFSIRADKIEISEINKTLSDDEIALAANIINFEFQGQFYFVEVELANKNRMLCYLPEEKMDDELIIPNKSVLLSWKRHHINIFDTN